MPKKFIILPILVLIPLAILYFSPFKENSPVFTKNASSDKKTAYIDNIKLSVEIADEPGEQIQGLSDKISLPQNEGMLFIFPAPFVAGFWMKDMNFPIDIIWIDKSRNIIGIEKAVSPDTFPKTFSPASPVKYVLEVNAGWADKNNIKIGDALSI